MKVLFVSSGRRGRISEIIKNQGNSLEKAGIDIHYYIIRNGFRGYLTGIYAIHKLYKKEKFDMVHAHYSLSAFTASLAGNFNLVVSLLGSDAYKSKFTLWITRLFYRYRWDKTIVKTRKIKNILRMDQAEIIPNGVDVDRFKPIPRVTARKKIGFPSAKKLIVFVADPSRKEKNYKLAVQAVRKLNMSDVKLLPVFNVPNDEIPLYMNASDALLLTSDREGSVNVVKEAMACNIPIVSTDVGDVKENTKDLPGCFICDSTPESLSTGLLFAFQIKCPIDSRKRIIESELDSESVAKRLISIYHQVCGGSN